MKRARVILFWVGWLLLLSAPLVWVKLEFETATRQLTARFHAERGQLLREQVREHGLELLAVAAGIAALAVVKRKLPPVPWERFRAAVSDRYERLPSQMRLGLWLLMYPTLMYVLVSQLGDQQRGWGIFVGIYIILATGLNLMVGMTGLLVLGYAAFYAIGAYTFAILHNLWDVPFWAAFAPAAVVGALVGLLLGLPSIRLRGDYLAIVTLGFGEVLRILLKNLKEIERADGSVVTWTGGDEGLLIGASGKFPRLDPLPLFPDGVPREASGFFVVAMLAAVSVWLVRNLVHSRIGRAWIAIREDETAAAAMGIPVFRMKLLAFALSAAWGAVAGVCFAAHQGHIVPDCFGFIESIFILSMVILGGMGTVAGPVFGAVGFYLTYELLRTQLPALADYRLMIFGAIMLTMMVFRPQGLLGSRQRKIELGLE